MTTITITLPDELVERARAKGLLSPAAIEAYVRGKLQEQGGDHPDDESGTGNAFDPTLIEGLVNPAAFRKGTILGDIVGPFCGEWGEGD